MFCYRSCQTPTDGYVVRRRRSISTVASYETPPCQLAVRLVKVSLPSQGVGDAVIVKFCRHVFPLKPQIATIGSTFQTWRKKTLHSPAWCCLRFIGIQLMPPKEPKRRYPLGWSTESRSCNSRSEESLSLPPPTPE